MIIEIAIIFGISLILVLASGFAGAYIYHRGIKMSFLRDKGYHVPVAPEKGKKSRRRAEDSGEKKGPDWLKGT